jgi:TonB family protein
MEPIYPRRAANRGRSGMVKLEFTVTENGYADKITVLKSKGGVSFEKNAIQAVKRWRYAPKFENGQAVAAKTHVQLDFDIVK